MKSVLKAFDVLFAVAQADTPPTVASLASTLALPRSTVHRILDSLMAAGVVARKGPQKGFVVTPKLAVAASAGPNTATLADLIVPFLHRLVAASEETSSLHVRVGDLRVCAAEVEGSRGIRWARGPGWNAPIWAGAVGRMLMAGMGEAELDELLRRTSFHTLAPNTVTNETQLRALVEDVGAQGWSSSESETVDGAAAVAVPVVTGDGRTVAALSLYASADRLSHIEAAVPHLQLIASEAATQWCKVSTFASSDSRADNSLENAV